MINHKPPHAERVISVIPIWTTETADEDVWTTPMGKKGQEGLKIWVEGPDYAGSVECLSCRLRLTCISPSFADLSTSTLLVSTSLKQPSLCSIPPAYFFSPLPLSLSVSTL
jgi:hypothetical protein